MIKLLLRTAGAALVCCVLAAGPAALAQSTTIPGGAVTVGGQPVDTQPVATWGLDSISHLKCLVGSTATCQTPTAGGSGASTGVNGATAPTSSTQTGWVDGSNTLQPDSAANPHPVIDAQAHTDAGAPVSACGDSPCTRTIGNTGGAETQGAAVSGGLVRSGCRAATTLPAALADTFGNDLMCTSDGKLVNAPFAPEALRQRGTGSGTTGALAFTGWSAPGGGAFAYVTGVECHREDIGTTPIHITLNDTVSTVLGLPATGGIVANFAVPLRVNSANTAPTFTLSATVSGGSAYCSAQGYAGN